MHLKSCKMLHIYFTEMKIMRQRFCPKMRKLQQNQFCDKMGKSAYLLVNWVNLSASGKPIQDMWVHWVGIHIITKRLTRLLTLTHYLLHHHLLHHQIHHHHDLHLPDDEKLEGWVGIARGGQGAGICQTRVWNINSSRQCLDKNYSRYENLKCRHT